MKKLLLLVVLVIFLANVNGQETTEKFKTNNVTIGILHGGGSIVGVDYEKLLAKSIGLQLGAGFVGVGAGLNFHFKPTIRSSFMSLQYWHQGIGEGHSQSIVSANYVFRGKKWLTFTVGLGIPTAKGPAWPEDKTQSPVILTYAIGGYIPW